MPRALTIFDDTERTDRQPAPHGETQFPYLNRAADDVFGRVRAVIEDWFTAYPSGGSDAASDAREELRGRFRSGDDTDFASAFWELYLHEAHRRAGYRVTPHPPTPSGARIDFLMESDTGNAFYLEATGMMRDSLSGAAYPPGTDDVLNKLNKAFDPDFWVAVEVIVPGRQAPTTRSVTEPVERWLRTLTWSDVVTRCVDGSDPYPNEMIQLGGHGWQVVLRAHPKPEHRRGDRRAPMIFAYPGFGGVSSAQTDILAKLKVKASRYGRLDAPYVIALHALPIAADELDIENALSVSALSCKISQVGRKRKAVACSRSQSR